MADLLTTLDAIVRADPSPAGLAGSLAFGTVEGTQQRWWRADFEASVPDCAFLSEPPLSCQLLVGIKGASGLRAFLDGDGERHVYGDVALLRRFIARYFTTTSPLSVRFGSAGKEPRL